MVVLSWGFVVIVGSCVLFMLFWILMEFVLVEWYVEILKWDVEVYFLFVEYYFRCIDD